MSKKEKTVSKSKHEEHYPIYIQSSNPGTVLLDWAAEMSKKTIVYFQSGVPIPPEKPPGSGDDEGD